MVVKKESTTITILAPKMAKAQFTLKGTGQGLIVHRFGHKAKGQVKGFGPELTKRKQRDPEAEYLDSFYLINKTGENQRFGAIEENAKFDKRKHLHGFPANAIKGAMISATVDLSKDVSKAMLKRNVFVHGKYRDLIEIESKDGPEMREDIVRLAGMTRAPDRRFRPWWTDWSMSFEMSWNEEILSLDSIANILSRAGMFIGLGERRPEKEGNTFGLFTVEKIKRVKA